MHGVILAAGEGSRMEGHTEDRPKAFLELDGRTLYERQRNALAPHVETVTVVLGYEADAVREDLAAEDRALIFDEWRSYENGESLRRALADIRSDVDGSRATDPGSVVVLNGDVVVAPGAIEAVRRRHRETGASIVACLRGRQTEHTAIRFDREGRVTDYGELPGHRHAGLGVVAGEDVARAERYLRAHRSEWYPGIYPELDAHRVVIPGEYHVEINRPEHLRAARRRLPFEDGDRHVDEEAVATGDAESR